MGQKLIGKVAVITGASAGIGKACAQAFALEGAKLVLVARRKTRLDEMVKAIRDCRVTRYLSLIHHAICH